MFCAVVNSTAEQEPQLSRQYPHNYRCISHSPPTRSLAYRPNYKQIDLPSRNTGGEAGSAIDGANGEGQSSSQFSSGSLVDVGEDAGPVFHGDGEGRVSGGGGALSSGTGVGSADVHAVVEGSLPPLPPDISSGTGVGSCLLYTSPSPRDLSTSRMPSSA